MMITAKALPENRSDSRKKRERQERRRSVGGETRRGQRFDETSIGRVIIPAARSCSRWPLDSSKPFAFQDGLLRCYHF